MVVVAIVFSNPVYRVIDRWLVDGPDTTQELEDIAHRLPPSNRMAKRYRAMAEALRSGMTTYGFTADQTPMTSPTPPENEEVIHE